MRGRPLMVGPIIDEKVRKFMVLLYKKGGHVSRSIAATTAMVLLSRTDDQSVKTVVVTTWGKSLLQRIGFRRRAATTSKVEIPDSAKKEAGLQHHYHITSIVEKHKIPESLVINTVKICSNWTFYHGAKRCKESWRVRNRR